MATNILVTGGAGYIGSHTCKALAAAGFTPITYDNMVYGHDWAVNWGPLVRGDIFEWGALMAGALFGSLPVVILYSFFVDYYVSSMTGAVKE